MPLLSQSLYTFPAGRGGVQPPVPPGAGPAGPGDRQGVAGPAGGHRHLPRHPAGGGGGQTQDVLQVQLHLPVQGGGHDQPRRAEGLEADVQSSHYESFSC